jgi:ribonuclease Y
MESAKDRISQQQKDMESAKEEIEQLKQKQFQQLEAIAGITLPQAKESIFKKAEDDAKYELALRYRDLERQVKEEADEKARKVVTLAIQRLANGVVSEHTTSTITLPSDDMKGRLIGREGRNIKALEALTGVDVIVDDTPGVVTISCFDPIRRQVARLATEKLIQDGRIHPARIEDMVEKAQEEIEEIIKSEGQQAVFDAGIRGLNPEMVKLLGRLKFRYSYGENVLRHSVEVSLIAGMLAAEIGANVEVAKLGGLLHDIGKALTHEVDGPHAEIGADIAKKMGIHPDVHRAIMEHHDEERGSVEAFLVAAADAISAARPGARRETAENYVKRLVDLETVAGSFPGVEKVFAIQAGREVRIMAKPDNLDDVACNALARDIVKKIEENLTFPGQIKVSVIRETRSVEYAR